MNTEFHRSLHQLAEIGVEALDAVFLPALSRVGKDGLARAGLLIGVDQKVGKHEKCDGDELHELDAAVQVDLEDIRELRERRRREQRPAERRQNGHDGCAERKAKQLAELDLRLAASLFQQHAAQADRRERRHHNAAGHREDQAEHRGSQHRKAGKAERADGKQDRAPALADKEE